MWARRSADPRTAVAAVFNVMRNVSVPIGIKIPGQPNIADTLWLTVSDQKNKVYYHQDAKSPSVVWADMKKLNFSEGSGARKLQLAGNPDVGGDRQFQACRGVHVHDSPRLSGPREAST